MRITVPRIRIAQCPVILVTLLIRPVSNTDNAEFYETAKTYSELFEVVGALLYDRLTKPEMFLRKRCHPSHMFIVIGLRENMVISRTNSRREFRAGRGFADETRKRILRYDKRPDTMDRFFFSKSDYSYNLWR